MPTSPCWPTPSCWPTSSSGSARATARRRRGAPASRASNTSGPTSPTPTCGSGPRTSGPWATRCCAPSPAPRGHSCPASGVLVARDLTPADAAALDLDAVTGVVLAYGSASSHAAILARARDIPLVVAAGREVLTVPEGTVIAIDGTAGELHVDPPAEVLAEFRTRQDDLAARRAEHLDAGGAAGASPSDGTSFLVLANIGSVADARAAAAAGADGAGLVRTEFLFLGRSTPPDLDEQQATYDAIADALPGRRITLRTLDVGGDKPLAYLPLPPEQNPFLGMRGIRLSLDRRDLLVEQLTAICRTARPLPHERHVPDGDDAGRARRGAPGAHRRGGVGWPPGRAARRDDGRGAGGGPEDRELPAAPRLRQHRHERPDAVHAGRGARKRCGSSDIRCSGPGRAAARGPGLPGRGRSRGGRRVRRGGVRRARPAGPRRAGRARAQRLTPRRTQGEGQHQRAGRRALRGAGAGRLSPWPAPTTSARARWRCCPAPWSPVD